MAYSFRETFQLRAVVTTLTDFVTTTKRSIESISSDRSLNSDKRQKLTENVKTLEKALDIVSSLELYFECKIREEADSVRLRRNMEDAKVLCDAIRAARRGQYQPTYDDRLAPIYPRASCIRSDGSSDDTSVWWSDDEETVYEEPPKSGEGDIGEPKEKKAGKLTRIVNSMPLLRRSKMVSRRLPCISETSDA